MVMSEYHSTVLLPKIEKPYPSILDFLTNRFPAIGRDIWKDRINDKKVLTEQGDPIYPETTYTPLKRLHYFREVSAEPVIPFNETIVFCNDELLVACKPHFLPVTPSGPYVTECLLHRLKEKTQNRDLVPINRIDRETAGLVLFSMNPETRGRYHELFMNGEVEKTYYAVTEYPRIPETKSWVVKNRIITGNPWFRMKIAPGKPNAVSRISLVTSEGNRGLFQLSPATGKKHQLRLHLSGLGFPILNDRVYPVLLPLQEMTFESPLQLLAQKIGFRDPVSKKQVIYQSDRRLCLKHPSPLTSS